MDNDIIGRKIGIMGGTFNPIHYGHLMLAEQIRTSFHLDEVMFIPVGKAPHKTLEHTADKYQRFEMTKRAIESNPYFTISDIEIKSDGTSYTIDTIRTLKKTLHINDVLYFITGADAILQLETWKDYQQLTGLVKFIGATRPGIDNASLEQKIENFKNTYHAEIELHYIPALAISSTDIRERVSQEKSIRYLLPESVEDFIKENMLYKTHHERFFEFYRLLKNTLSKKRFVHSIETARVARKLAFHYGVDPIKAEFAGLCHDMAKEYKNALMLKYVAEFDIYKDPSIIQTPNLAHGEVAAGILKKHHHFDDEDVLDAIRWHTYGQANMATLSKIIYVADIIEDSRTFEGVEQLRILAYRGLDETILAFNKRCEIHLAKKDLSVHAYTAKMLESITRKNQN